MTGYAETYRRSLQKPEEFWAEAAEAIDWERRWDRVLDDTRPPFYRWFAGARLNTCWNALDRHVAAGQGERLPLIWDSPVTEKILRFTYRELRDRTARFAGVLAGLGVKTGDRVLIYMPMVPEAAIAMFACARIGAIHSVVFGGFASHELATRIDDANAIAIVSASCGVEINRVIPYKPLLAAGIEEARSNPNARVLLHPTMRRADMHAGRDNVRRDQRAGPRRKIDREIRSHAVSHPLPRGRAGRSADRAMGGGKAEGAGHRPLVADRDGLADRRQLPRRRAIAGQVRLLHKGGAGLGCARAGRRRHRPGDRNKAGRDRRHRGQIALAARHAPDLVAAGRALCRILPDDLSRLLPDRRCRAHRRGWLHPCHDPHRRHHQCRGASALDRRHGGGAGCASRCRRMRRHGCSRSAERSGAI